MVSITNKVFENMAKQTEGVTLVNGEKYFSAYSVYSRLGEVEQETRRIIAEEKKKEKEEAPKPKDKLDEFLDNPNYGGWYHEQYVESAREDCEKCFLGVE